MAPLVFFILIGVFGILIFINFYFRVKVLKLYRYLVQNRVQFDFGHFLDGDRMEEIYQRYPEHEQEIKRFVLLIRRSVLLASALLAAILVFGYILIRNR